MSTAVKNKKQQHNHNTQNKCVVQTACGHVYMAVKDSDTIAPLQGLKK